MQADPAASEGNTTMTTMTAISGTTAFHGRRPGPAARPACRSAGAVRKVMHPVGPLVSPWAADLRRTMETAAGATARFALALLPVSALAGMFVWL